MTVWDAVLVAGGSGRRLGTIDKPALSVRGRTLLDTAVEACAMARTTVVVGPVRQTSRPVRWTHEHPAGGGPLAALAAGTTELTPDADVIVALATDLPAVTADTVAVLVEAAADNVGDGAAGRDLTGRQQPLLAAYRSAALRRALTTIGDPHGRSLRELTALLDLVSVDLDDAASDIDTPAELRRWQQRTEEL